MAGRTGGGVGVLFGDCPGARDDAWLTDAVRTAVLDSDEMWCEVPDPAEVAGHPRLLEVGLSPDRVLSDRLGAERTKRFEAVARSLGLDPAGLQGLRPWLVAQLVEQALRAQAGLTAAHAVDRVLLGLAREHGIPVRSEFSIDEVLGRFGQMPESGEVQYLDNILERAEGGVASMGQEFTAWASGDLSIGESIVRQHRAKYPMVHQAGLTERNAAWIPRIETMLDTPGA
ncbi:MAG TPA: TraB/GumN family protein [Acidimicrobiales bacterium]|nr:TraB/GumN family protein [Acidimicrobiales bacterium]